VPHRTIVQYEGGKAKQLDSAYMRDEQEQAREIIDLLNIFREEGVDSVFLNTTSLNLSKHGAGGLKVLLNFHSISVGGQAGPELARRAGRKWGPLRRDEVLHGWELRDRLKTPQIVSTSVRTASPE
jgi:hypothetical protein